MSQCFHNYHFLDQVQAPSEAAADMQRDGENAHKNTVLLA